MLELHDITESLLDHDDGSCRDVTFQSCSWDGVALAVDDLARTFRTEAAHDSEGLVIPTPFGAAVGLLAASTQPGYLCFLFESAVSIIQRLQLFVGKDEVGAPLVEATFFPEDVDQTGNVKECFVRWANDLQAVLRAQRYYARYENASWTLGDVGPTSGVFLVSNELSDGA
jgi:hypothetical protein